MPIPAAAVWYMRYNITDAIIGFVCQFVRCDCTLIALDITSLIVPRINLTLFRWRGYRRLQVSIIYLDVDRYPELIKIVKN